MLREQSDRSVNQEQTGRGKVKSVLCDSARTEAARHLKGKCGHHPFSRPNTTRPQNQMVDLNRELI